MRAEVEVAAVVIARVITHLDQDFLRGGICRGVRDVRVVPA